MNQKKNAPISRREFALRAAAVSAVAILPANALAAETLPVTSAAVSSPQEPPPPKLSPEGQAEVDARFQSILSQYGNRLSEGQKSDLRRLCVLAQPPLDRLRKFTAENGDGPALYLKPLIEREKKPSAPIAANKSIDAAKKP